MVQQTLDATKTFIFDVRPMVLDDLGLVPTLRRAARERGRRAGVAVEFDSIGQDRRIAVDLESSLFRIIDEALSALPGRAPDRVAIRLDWSDDVVEARVSADARPDRADGRCRPQEAEAAAKAVAGTDKDLPPALESMMADRQERAAEVPSGRARGRDRRPAGRRRGGRSSSGRRRPAIAAELGDGGGELRIPAELGRLPMTRPSRPIG